MIATADLVSFCDNLLEINQYTDYAPNGLQVEGKKEIKIICSAVTASLAAIKKAIALKADALLVHHGYFWQGEKPNICGIKKKRVENLLASDINLIAYHLPLDGHLELGNNAALGQLLNVTNIKAHKAGKNKNLIWSGTLAKATNAANLASFLQEKLKNEPLCIEIPNLLIKKIAWCTGAAQDYLYQAYELGVDAFISGEISERTYHEAHELGIHYFSCGHHATERFGVQALGKKLAEQFNLQHYFIDSNNPI